MVFLSTVWCKDGGVMEELKRCPFCGGEAGQGHKNKVLAWMPLPEPYKEN